jgi:hypothetical protein
MPSVFPGLGFKNTLIQGRCQPSVSVAFEIGEASLGVAIAALAVGIAALYFPLRDSFRAWLAPYVVEIRQPTDSVSVGQELDVRATVTNRSRSTELFFFGISGSHETIEVVTFETKWFPSNKKVDYSAEVPPGESRDLILSLRPSVAGNFDLIVSGTALHGRPQFERALAIRFRAM